MKKQTQLIPGLLTTFLLSFTSTLIAQESVSDYEQSLVSKSKAVKQIQPDNKLTALAVNLDMQALANELETRGWDIKKNIDGSLILSPKESSAKPADKVKSIDNQWPQLQQKFHNAGWSAVIDNDGSMRLTPPDKSPETQTEPPSQTIESNQQTSTNTSFRDIQQKLKETGWNVTKNSDGSMLLYPPKPVPEEDLSAKKKASKKRHSCPGKKTGVEVYLPVDSWQEAHDIAQGWLKNESMTNSAVGKIRKIINVYIISIVSNKAPFHLVHQIAIKNSNGAVIVLN